jgi:diguanylate cyclase (GGDEF)-like protein
MHIDYTSLLVALAFSSISVFAAGLISWMSTRKDRYLIFNVLGVGLIAVGVVLMGLRNGRFELETLSIPFTALLAGLAFVHASIRLFWNRSNLWPPLLIGVACILATEIPFLLGWMGLGGININVAISLIALFCGLEYLRSDEDPRSISLAIAMLFLLIALSFFSTALLLTFKGEWLLYPSADMWWDNVNAIVALVGVSGIGVLTLTLHLARKSRRHHIEANTDPLTGVLNRRGLFKYYCETDIVPGLSVLQFDLDYFKQINDRFGHAQGDATLQKFAEILRAQTREDDIVARTGGEEFCMVLPGKNLKAARATAERVRLAFTEMAIPSGQPDTVATVSIGLAIGGKDETFRSVLSRADAALYRAKSMGRNKVQEDTTSLAA